MLNVPICTQGMQRTWWPGDGTTIVTGPYCMRRHLVTGLHWTPSCILDKVVTHIRQGFILYEKRYHLDQLSKECTLRQCYVYTKQKTTPYRHDPDISRSLMTEVLRLKSYGLGFIYTYHKPRYQFINMSYSFNRTHGCHIVTGAFGITLVLYPGAPVALWQRESRIVSRDNIESGLKNVYYLEHRLSKLIFRSSNYMRHLQWIWMCVFWMYFVIYEHAYALICACVRK